MNLYATARKLQMALSQQGRYFKINQAQTYSEKADRMVTKYILIEQKHADSRNINRPIIETYRLIDIVRELAAVYEGGK